MSGLSAAPRGAAIFYPVLTREYAEQIARDWNSESESTGHVGYVTRFAVHTAFLARHERKQVGAALHLEYWVPSAELAEFNRHIVGSILLLRPSQRLLDVLGKRRAGRNRDDALQPDEVVAVVEPSSTGDRSSPGQGGR